MTATKRTTIRKHASQCFAVATFTIGLALGSAAIASAEWDIEAYDKCMAKTVRDPVICCFDSGGIPTGPDFRGCQSPPVNDAMVDQSGPTRSPEEIVSGPVNEFNVPDAVVPGAPVLELPTP